MQRRIEANEQRRTQGCPGAALFRGSCCLEGCLRCCHARRRALHTIEHALLPFIGLLAPIGHCARRLQWLRLSIRVILCLATSVSIDVSCIQDSIHVKRLLILQ